jgi:hypothetical protein
VAELSTPVCNVYPDKGRKGRAVRLGSSHPIGVVRDLDRIYRPDVPSLSFAGVGFRAGGDRDRDGDGIGTGPLAVEDGQDLA